MMEKMEFECIALQLDHGVLLQNHQRYNHQVWLQFLIEWTEGNPTSAHQGTPRLPQRLRNSQECLRQPNLGCLNERSLSRYTQ
jgi:hypothetical protein